jgi:hypothetical protein
MCLNRFTGSGDAVALLLRRQFVARRLFVAAAIAAAAGCSASRDSVAPSAAAVPSPTVQLLALATFDEAEPPSVLRPEFTCDGLGGRALTGAAVWQVPALGRFQLREGTVEFRLRLDLPSAQIPNWTMFRIRLPGKPPEDSYLNGFHVIHGWGRGLFLLVGDSEARQQPLRYGGTSDWKPGEWHHCAFTWRLDEPGRSTLAFYVDEKLVERHDNLTLRFDAAAWAAAATSEGSDRLLILAGAVWGQPSPGAIDDIRIYDHIRRYEVNP